MAQRAKGDLIAVHVRPQDGLTAAGLRRPRPAADARRALGGTYRDVVGDDVGKALVDTARRMNATQIVLGATRRSRLTELLRGSVIRRVIRDSGEDVDVHVISHASGAPESPGHRRPTAFPATGSSPGRCWPQRLLPRSRSSSAALRDDLGLPSVLLLYLLVVVVVSAVGGIWPALAAAVAGFLLTNWYFTPPLYTFTIGEGENLLALAIFLVVAVTVSGFVSLAARRATEGSARARRRRRSRGWREPRASSRSSSRSAGRSPSRASPCGIETTATGRGRGGGTHAERGERSLRVDGEPRARARRPARAGRRAPAARRVRDASSPARIHIEELEADASEADDLERVNDLRLAILSAVSHDLRTPLAGIKASVTSLLDDEIDWPEAERQDFLATIDAETDRLDGLVGNLLDMSRLQTGALQVAATPIGLDEVVPAALRSIGSRADEVDVDVAETLPRVVADPGLLERAIANVVQNALVHGVGGAGTRRRRGRRRRRRPPRRRPWTRRPASGSRPHLRAVPAARRQPAGGSVGLGLAVARGFVEAMGGTRRGRGHARRRADDGSATARSA